MVEKGEAFDYEGIVKELEDTIKAAFITPSDLAAKADACAAAVGNVPADRAAYINAFNTELDALIDSLITGYTTKALVNTDGDQLFFADSVEEYTYGEYFNDLILGELATSARWDRVPVFQIDPSKPFAACVIDDVNAAGVATDWRSFRADEAELVYELLINNMYAITQYLDSKYTLVDFIASLPVPFVK